MPWIAANVRTAPTKPSTIQLLVLAVAAGDILGGSLHQQPGLLRVGRHAPGVSVATDAGWCE